jgi:A/G-specific adenine glycosylase
MAALREATEPVPEAALRPLWADDEQRDRALAGLLLDGLARRDGTGYRLP